MIYKKEIDYEDYLKSVAEELESNNKFYISDVEVSGTEKENNLKLEGILHINEYDFNIKARYIIDNDTIDNIVTISYDSTQNYELTENEVKEIHDCTVLIKKMMRV